jgi:polysaccharide export outer membrane protein
MKSILCIALFALSLVPACLKAQIEAGAAIIITIQGVPVGEQGRINATYPVSERGFITMWHVGSIKAAGLQPDVLARQIESLYRTAQIYTSPTIQILADSSDRLTQQVITVGGKVRVPGPKPYSRNMTLYAAVMAAGGPTEFGALNRVSLYRNNKRYIYDLSKGSHKLLKVFPRDTIVIPQKNWFGR